MKKKKLNKWCDNSRELIDRVNRIFCRHLFINDLRVSDFGHGIYIDTQKRFKNKELIIEDDVTTINIRNKVDVYYTVAIDTVGRKNNELFLHELKFQAQKIKIDFTDFYPTVFLWS